LCLTGITQLKQSSAALAEQGSKNRTPEAGMMRGEAGKRVRFCPAFCAKRAAFFSGRARNHWAGYRVFKGKASCKSLKIKSIVFWHELGISLGVNDFITKHTKVMKTANQSKSRCPAAISPDALPHPARLRLSARRAGRRARFPSRRQTRRWRPWRRRSAKEENDETD
jgi:hypothetical protein